MSFQVGSACYATETQAAQVAASSQAGAVVSQGGSLYVVGVDAVDATSITYEFHPMAGGSPVVVVTPYNAQPCGLLGVSDGVEMGWMVAGAWLATFAVIGLVRAFTGWGDQHGDS